jgi:hypothetical protein
MVFLGQSWWIRIRKKSFRIWTAPDSKWIWSKIILKTGKIWQFLNKNAQFENRNFYISL